MLITSPGLQLIFSTNEPSLTPVSFPKQLLVLLWSSSSKQVHRISHLETSDDSSVFSYLKTSRYKWYIFGL